MMNKLFIFICTAVSVFSQTWESYKQQALKNQSQIPGWCNVEKAHLLMEYVYLAKPLVCVEIGSFQGSTSFAIGQALAFNKMGMLHTVDTWKFIPDSSKKQDYNQFANFWHTLDLDGDLVYLDFLVKHFQSELRSYIHPIRIDSLKAALLFPMSSIDMLYLDGDTTERFAMEELLTFFPKVKHGGAIWLNRADLESKRSLVEYLMESCHYEKSWSYGIECVLFIKK